MIIGFTLLALSLGAASRGAAQAPPAHGTITGTVSDSSTSLPVEGAIAFIALSGIGSSTGTDGRFTLPRVPAGEHDLIVSRVGYHREAVHVLVEAGDTLKLELLLAGYPIPAGEAEVLADAPVSPSPSPLFFPDGGERSWCAYGSETEVPVGILFTERALYFYHLDTAVIGGERYLRFWLLIYNGSVEPISFDVERDLRLDLEIAGRRYRLVKPDRELAATARNGGNPRLLSADLPVERTLMVMASQSQFFIDEATRFDLAGSGTGGYPPAPWLGWLNPPEHPSGVNPRHLKNVYDHCEHDGALRAYTIAPASGVDGTLWYPMPGFDRAGSGQSPGAGLPGRCEFTLKTPTGEEHLVFSMH